MRGETCPRIRPIVRHSMRRSRSSTISAQIDPSPLAQFAAKAGPGSDPGRTPARRENLRQIKFLARVSYSNAAATELALRPRGEPRGIEQAAGGTAVGQPRTAPGT